MPYARDHKYILGHLNGSVLAERIHTHNGGDRGNHWRAAERRGKLCKFAIKQVLKDARVERAAAAATSAAKRGRNVEYEVIVCILKQAHGALATGAVASEWRQTRQTGTACGGAAGQRFPQRGSPNLAAHTFLTTQKRGISLEFFKKFLPESVSLPSASAAGRSPRVCTRRSPASSF